jgi:hypothetical protein
MTLPFEVHFGTMYCQVYRQLVKEKKKIHFHLIPQYNRSKTCIIFPEKLKLNQETTSPMLTSCYRNPIMMKLHYLLQNLECHILIDGGNMVFCDNNSV